MAPASAAPAPAAGFPKAVHQLAAAPASVADVLTEIEAIFTSLPAKFGTINWTVLLGIVVPDLISGNYAKLLMDILANIGTIFTGTVPPSSQAVEAELRKSPMFATV